jgi:CubicO group peptidase (beta-lactamase class C family)
MRKHDLPALAGAVVTSGGLIAKGAVGVRRYGKLTPVTVDDQFHLGSDTKAMTATLLALLVEEGKLSWQTTLAQALPGLASGMDPAYRSVTLEQLLAHRAGFTSESWPRGKTFMDMQNLRGSPRRQRWAYSRLILKEPPQAPPGSRYLYSNRSYAIAGVIAEQTEGQPWEKLMRERLFKPLGMETCGFGAMGHPGRTDQPWQHTVASLMHESIAPGKLSDNPVVIAPAGLIHCSVGDWGKFVTAHLRGEKGLPGLLKPETFRKLHSSPYGDYGFGWLLAERPWGGGRVLTHAGSNNSNFAVVWAAPQRDFAVLVMTNQGGDEAAAAADEAAGALMADYLKKP